MNHWADAGSGWSFRFPMTFTSFHLQGALAEALFPLVSTSAPPSLTMETADQETSNHRKVHFTV